MKTALFCRALGAAALAAVFASLPARAHPLEGRIWDNRSASFVRVESVFARAAASRYVLLGEQHDSALQHALQLDVLKALAARGRTPALALEQFDQIHQPALDAARQAGERDPERLADAGQLNRKSWRWPMYRDLIGFAAGHGWPLLAANLSREDARQIALGQRTPELPPADPAQQAALEDDIVRGHCGQRPAPARLAAIVTAQRARDARMAEVIERAGGPVVLVAGAGHVRRDRALARYLHDDAGLLAIGFIEVDEKKPLPAAYDGAGFDLLWFTAPTTRPDPCAVPPGGTVAPAPTTPTKEKP